MADAVRQDGRADWLGCSGIGREADTSSAAAALSAFFDLALASPYPITAKGHTKPSEHAAPITCCVVLEQPGWLYSRGVVAGRIHRGGKRNCEGR